MYVGRRRSQSQTNGVDADDGRRRQVDSHLPSKTVPGRLDTGRPDDLRLSTIMPIPKGKNTNQTDSSNYRGIVLGSLLGNVFDLLLLDRYSDLLVTSQLQFGFKPACRSTNMCTMVLKETISYYTAHRSSVYCTMLEATKAFDRVKYTKLFRVLMVRRLLPVVLRILLFMYTHSSARVLWNGCVSKHFSVSNGVKQGSVLSPVLFCVSLMVSYTS